VTRPTGDERSKRSPVPGPFPVAKDLQERKRAQQLARPKEKLLPSRTATGGSKRVGEMGLVSQDAAGTERLLDPWEQFSVEVVEHNDETPVVWAAGQRGTWLQVEQLEISLS